MKPDLKLFPDLKEDTPFQHWREKFETTAFGAGLGPCVDMNYAHMPGTAEEEDFNARNLWLYTILTHKVHTVSGREIVRDHLVTRDGRRAFYDIICEFHQSTTADLRVDWLNRQIAAMRVNSSTGSLLTFMVKYC